jgi:hypothetical protein
MLASNKEMMDRLQELDPVRIVDRELARWKSKYPSLRSGWRPR